jgi:methionyl-tRNA formyltransferase
VGRNQRANDEKAKIMNTYVYASIKSWNLNEFENIKKSIKGNWVLITNKLELNKKKLEMINPDYIFFPHWNWIVPQEITGNFNCVCFHMTDVPYGRGGSPLQNLIVRGHDCTKLTALKMTSELDAGDVYHKVDLSLHGSAQEIFERASKLVNEMIKYIIERRPILTKQQGVPTYFERRKPKQSVISDTMNKVALYDHIRMLDAEGYPKAYIEIDKAKIEFSNALIDELGNLTANATFIEFEE